MKYNQIPSQEVIEKTAQALEANGIHVIIAENGQEAAKKVFEIVPQGAEVMDMTSTTLNQIGVSKEITESGKYNAIRPKLYEMDSKLAEKEKKQMGTAPEWVLGSVHAITQDGKVLVASATGSQLPAYEYGAAHVLWVAGAHKIVPDVNAATKRIYDYVLPLESERARKAYGVPGSSVNKLFILNKEVVPNRITMILVREPLGF